MEEALRGIFWTPKIDLEVKSGESCRISLATGCFGWNIPTAIKLLLWALPIFKYFKLGSGQLCVVQTFRVYSTRT